MKRGHFQPIFERFMKRLTNWDGRFMSHGAKDNLVRSVAQELPKYTMIIFKMGVGFCGDYDKAYKRLWAGDMEENRKVHWMSWKKMTTPKKDGGISLRA